MDNKYLQRFVLREGIGSKYDDIKPETILKYKETLKTNKDESNIVLEIWSKYGLCSYRSGLFWTINPDEYAEIIRLFPNISENAIAFARTNLGNFFLFDRLNIGDSIIFLNIHTGKTKIISTSFEILFAIEFGADSFWKEDCYGKIELKANKKYGQMEEDECYTFVPALALGGDEKISNLEKVKIKENLSLLAQLHSS